METAADTKEDVRGCDSEKDSSSKKKDIKQPKSAKLSTLDPPLRCEIFVFCLLLFPINERT